MQTNRTFSKNPQNEHRNKKDVYCFNYVQFFYYTIYRSTHNNNIMFFLEHNFVVHLTDGLPKHYDLDIKQTKL